MPETKFRRRDDFVAVLRRVGLHDVADDTQLHLPESVTLDQVIRFLQERGVSRDLLTDMLGGSP